MESVSTTVEQESTPSTGDDTGKTPGPLVNYTNEDFQFHDSDLELVSSDSLHFKLHRYHLQAASPVFRDTLAIATTGVPTIELSDPSIETSNVLQAFLCLLHGTPFPIPDVGRERETFDEVVNFLQKYECKTALRTLSYYLQGLAGSTRKDRDMLEIFIAAALMDDIDTATQAIRHSWGEVWAKTPEPVDPLTCCIAGKPEFDTTGWPWFIVQRVPTLYMMGLVRATSKFQVGINITTDWKRVGTEFQRIMLEHKAQLEKAAKDKAAQEQAERDEAAKAKAERERIAAEDSDA